MKPETQIATKSSAMQNNEVGQQQQVQQPTVEQQQQQHNFNNHQLQRRSDSIYSNDFLIPVNDKSNTQLGKLIRFNLHGNGNGNGEFADLEKNGDKGNKFARRCWRLQVRLMSCFCCLGYKKNKTSFDDISRIFSRVCTQPYFGPSAIYSSIKIIKNFRRAQAEWMLKQPELGVKQILSSIPITKETKFLDLTHRDDVYLINDMIYFMNYSLAIFGYAYYAVDGAHQICCLAPYLKMNCCKPTPEEGDDLRLAKQQDFPIVLNDNWLAGNTAGADRRMRGHNYEMIYINFKSSVNKVAFLVALDHSKRTVVVSIRGTMSLADAITDINATPHPIPMDPPEAEMYGHKGMVLCAQYVKQKLDGHKLLETAFAARPDLGSQNYRLLICGQSLGAGVASILGLLLYPRYPQLTAYLYSPPGGLLSRRAMELSRKFAIAIFLGNDIVPRLGVAQTERAKYHAFWAKQRVAAAQKEQDSQRSCLSRLLRKRSAWRQPATYAFDPDTSLDFFAGQDSECPPIELAKSSGRVDRIRFPAKDECLFVPGKLIHVLKDFETSKSELERRGGRVRNPNDREPLFRAIWANNEDYDRIVCEDGMFMDHMPHSLFHSMKRLFARTLPPGSAPFAPIVQEQPKSTLQFSSPIWSTQTNQPQQPDQQQQQQQQTNVAQQASSSSSSVHQLKRQLITTVSQDQIIMNRERDLQRQQYRQNIIDNPTINENNDDKCLSRL